MFFLSGRKGTGFFFYYICKMSRQSNFEDYKQNILRIEQGTKNLSLRRTFNRLLGGSKRKREGERKRSFRNQKHLTRRLETLFRVPDEKLLNYEKRIKYGGLYRRALTKRDQDSLRSCLRTTKPRKVHQPVYVSCTSEPKRLLYLPFVLSTIDFDTIAEVHINLPRKYKNTIPYSEEAVEMLKGLHPKVKVYRPANDIGPATKVLFTIDRLKRKYKGRPEEPICISIDDDVAYHSDLFSTLASYVERKGGVWASWGFDMDTHEGLEYIEWPRHDKSQVDVVEGFSGIAYPVKRIDTKRIKGYARKSLKCKLSDDLTISLALQQTNLPTRLIPGRTDRYLTYDGWVEPLAYGEAEGLHTQTPPPGFATYNSYKYSECWNQHLRKSAT